MTGEPSVRCLWLAGRRRNQDPIIAALEERLALWSQIPVVHQEDLQVLRYSPGEKFDPHYDMFGRVMTVIMYLMGACCMRHMPAWCGVVSCGAHAARGAAARGVMLHRRPQWRRIQRLACPCLALPCMVPCIHVRMVRCGLPALHCNQRGVQPPPPPATSTSLSSSPPPPPTPPLHATPPRVLACVAPQTRSPAAKPSS